MNTFNTTGFRCNVSKELRMVETRSLDSMSNVKKEKRNVSLYFQYERGLKKREIKQSLRRWL